MSLKETKEIEAKPLSKKKRKKIKKDLNSFDGFAPLEDFSFSLKDVEKLIDEKFAEVREEADEAAEKKRAIFREGARLLKEISDDCGGKPIGQKFKFLSMNFEKIASECF